MPAELKDFISPITSTVGAGMGLLLEKHEDQRQYNQQKKLQDLQIQGQQAMGQFNTGLAKQMWDYTNFENQKKHLEAAGLNPGLMYGMGGGGGATTSTPTGNVNGADAPSGTGHEVQDMAGMGMQLAAQTQLIQSQIEVNKSIANKNNTEADFTGGVQTANTTADTSLKNTQVQSLTQGITNQKTQNALMQAQTVVQNMTAENIQTDTKKLEDQIAILDQDVEISRATINQKIEILRQQATGAILQNEATKVGINLTKEQIKNVAQQIENSKTNQQQMMAQIQQALSSAGLMDKEKSLLTAQTAIQAIGAVSNVLRVSK